jgi:sulfonate transport system substrate-binding protein
MSVSSRALRHLVLLGACAALLLSCQRSAPPVLAPIAPAGAPSAGASAPPRAPAEQLGPLVVRFADPGNAGIFAYAKREGILERELAKVDAQIVWVPAPGAFSASFDAMNSGAINASGGAVSPIVGALSHNLQFKIYGIADPGSTMRAGIVSPAASAIRAVRDLVGKRVAVNGAAHGDYILLEALAEAGIPAAQVQRVPIQPPEAAAAFATGKVDAWSTFGTFFSTAIKNGAHVLTVERDLRSDDVGVLAAHVGALSRNPAAFQTILRVAGELDALAHAHPERFQNVFRDKGPTAVSGDELRLATEDTRTQPAFRVPTAADRARVANVARIFFDNRSIDRLIAVDDIIYDVDQAARLRVTAAASPQR